MWGANVFCVKCAKTIIYAFTRCKHLFFLPDSTDPICKKILQLNGKTILAKMKISFILIMFVHSRRITATHGVLFGYSVEGICFFFNFLIVSLDGIRNTAVFIYLRFRIYSVLLHVFVYFTYMIIAVLLHNIVL